MQLRYPTNAAGWAELYPDIRAPAGYFARFTDDLGTDFAAIEALQSRAEMKRQIESGEDPNLEVARR